MRGRIHVDQIQRTTRRGEDRGTRKCEITKVADELRTGTAGASGCLRRPQTTYHEIRTLIQVASMATDS